MKKYFSLIIIFILVMMPVLETVSAYSQADYNYEVYEDFEDGTPANWNMGGTGTQYTITAETNEGYGGSGGSAKIVHRGQGTHSSELHIVPGYTYRISGYIKLLTDMDSKYDANKYVSFIFGSREDGTNYKQVNDEQLSLSTADWTYFEIDYAYDGYLKAAKDYVGDVVLDVYMRLCDPTITFLLDDFSIEIIAINGNEITSVDEETQKIVKQGDFETALDSSVWVMENVNSASTVYYGAKDTMSALKIDMQSGGKFGQTVETENGTQYKGEFYAKSISGVLKFIANDGAAYRELALSTSEANNGWTKYEFTYTATSDSTEFYFTTDGSDGLQFRIDEFSIFKTTESDDVLTAVNFLTVGKFMPGQTAIFKWDYTNGYEGKSAVKIYIDSGNGWTFFDSMSTADNSCSVNEIATVSVTNNTNAGRTTWCCSRI